MPNELATTTGGRMMAVPHYEEAINSLQARRDLVLQMMDKVLQPNIHYGVVPGTSAKPSLFLPGAETLSSAFGFVPHYRQTITREALHLIAEVTCELTLPDGGAVGEGIGCCSTYESKYRYRGGARLCPSCGKDTIIMGKEEYGGGWICFAKKGGCGAKFKKGDQSIEGQSIQRVENPDLADQWNTVIKMAAKRSFVHAVRTATGTADVFTQDLEDFRDSYGTVIDAEVLPPAAPAPAAQVPAAPPPAPNGWTIEAQGQFSDLLDNVLYKVFKDSGHPELFQPEADLWRSRKAKDPAAKVLGGLEKKIATLQAAAVKAAAPAPEPPVPTHDEYHGAPPAGSVPPVIPAPVAAPATLPEGDPEAVALAKTTFQNACKRFEINFAKSNVPDPRAQVIAFRDRTLANLAQTMPAAERDPFLDPYARAYQAATTLAARKLILAQAMDSKADQLKVPALVP